MLAASAWANINTSESGLGGRGNLTLGKVTTASVNLSGPSDTQTLYTTPAAHDFLLTQVCGSVGAGGVRLAITGFGTIAETGTEPCVTFSPGVIVPKNAAITCSTAAAATPGTSYFCTINGLQK